MTSGGGITEIDEGDSNAALIDRGKNVEESETL